MKWIRFTILFISAAALTLLDTSFFANLTVKNASIVSVFQLLIIFSLMADTKKYFVVVASSVIFFAIFSSLPMWMIFLLFFALPSAFLYLRKGHLPLPSLPIASILLVVANLIFELILLAYAKEWNSNGLLTLYYFVLINTIFGTFLYYFFHLFVRITTRDGKVKNF